MTSKSTFYVYLQRFLKVVKILKAHILVSA